MNKSDFKTTTNYGLTVSAEDKYNYYKAMENVSEDPNKNGSNEIPANLDEAVEWLKSNIPEKEQKAIAEGELNAPLGHHGIGRKMRNNWGLWSGSELQEYFHDLGIRHADDMSGIILTSFERDLRDEPRELEGQINHYRNYWKEKGVDPDKIGLEEE